MIGYACIVLSLKEVGAAVKKKYCLPSVHGKNHFHLSHKNNMKIFLFPVKFQ